MTEIRTLNEIEYMARAGQIIASCHKALRSIIRAGVTTMEIDRFVEEFIRSHGAKPEQKGYMGYPYASCTSVNDEICHAFPTNRKLQEGDIIKVDMVVNLEGWLADSAWCYAVGEVSEEVRHLMDVTRESLYLGIEKAIPGNRIGDISHAIQTYAEANGLSVVREFTGHGIGRVMHDGLHVPHYGKPGRGPRLEEGMVLTIEPMLNLGKYHLLIDANGWTARTTDGRWSAQYEHTIAVTGNAPRILTLQEEE